MKDKDKTAVMEAFKRGEYDCLVSTTVIEVGVDVPNATIMAIMNAERFGAFAAASAARPRGAGERQELVLLARGGRRARLPSKRLRILKGTSDGSSSPKRTWSFAAAAISSERARAENF